MLEFINHFTDALPADKISENFTRQVSDACYSFVEPTATKNPQVLSVSKSLAAQLGLSDEALDSDWFKLVFSGNQVSGNMKPYSMCYGGHQFGHWAGQLGDGRAINLAEVKDTSGQLLSLQLKGAGPTPYSRTADGLAVLRSSVREYLCSEAMAALGVATTRALSLSLTGDQVMRDMFYDGNATLEPGAVVCRVSPSFLRFGNYQLHAANNDHELLKQLVDYTIANHFPTIQASGTEKYEQWFAQICQSTMKMVIDWMRVGFVHGVMNTDNMSILGLTIDYGPYGWLEGYDPMWTPNTTDAQGKRYSFGNQPQIAQWNLFQLANAILPIVGRVEKLEQALENFANSYTKRSQSMYAKKLGLKQHLGETDQVLIDKLFELLQLTEIDMTIFFRCLSRIDFSQEKDQQSWLNSIEPAFYQPEELQQKVHSEFLSWLSQYQERLFSQSMSHSAKAKMMDQTNPKFILRNYLVQIAIDKAEQGDYSEIEKLLEIFTSPYDEQTEHEQYAQKRPEWARNRAGCSMLSCSS